MKIRIRARRGEVRNRAADIVRVIEHITGEQLVKSTDHHRDHGLTDEGLDPLIPELKEALDAARVHRDRIKALMVKRMMEVLA